MIAINIVEGPSSLESLAAEWDALIGDQFSSSFAQSSWFLAWQDAFPPSKLAIVTARRGQELVGLLPMARTRADVRGLFFTNLAPFARGNYEAPMVRPEDAAEVLPLMLEATVKHFGRYGTFWWPNIPLTDPALPVLRSWLKSRNMPYFEEQEVAPRLYIRGRSFEEVELDWTSSHRKDVRRQRKRMGIEKGAVSLWKPTSVDEADPVLTEFFQVHDYKWTSQGFPGMFTPSLQTHFRAIVRRLWNHGLHFSTVRCGDINVSYLLGFYAGGWLQYYRPTYRPEFGVYSPSKIHVGLIVEEACKNQLAGIDFLLGGYPYKYSWANETFEVTSIQAGFHRWAPSYLWFSQGKPWAKTRFTGAYNWAKMRLQRSPANEGSAQ